VQFEHDERRISGARYYTVKPLFDWWAPGSLSDTNINWRGMMEWCVTTFGPTPVDGVWTPGGRWYANNAKFWFRDKEDMLMFVMRWS